MIENTLLRLRRADRVDEARFLAWRNDPWIVALGSLNRTITAEEHRAWFTQRIADIRHPIWVIEIAGEPSGMVRTTRTSVPRAVSAKPFALRMRSLSVNGCSGGRGY